MRRRCALALLLLTCNGFAQERAASLPLWAYGYIEAPAAPADYSTRCLGNRPLDCDRPGGLPSDPANVPRRLSGSAATFTIAQINYRYGPADWFPEDHPVMPPVVARGKEAIGMRACALCHLPNGKGLMQNGGVAGLPVAYILQQLDDFRSGRRKSADHNKANAFEMAAIARNLTAEEARSAAEYFAAIPFTSWQRVVESSRVPKFTATVNGLFLRAEGANTEPLGERLIELPENTEQTNLLRNPRSGFVVYTPPGSLAKGRALSQGCGSCHGADLRGLGAVPPIAGRSASYIARQLHDIRTGARNSALAQSMISLLDKLTASDLIAIAAFVASLPPQGAQANARLMNQYAATPAIATAPAGMSTRR